MSKYLNFIGSTVATVKPAGTSTKGGLPKSAKIGIGLTLVGAIGMIYSNSKSKKEVETTLPSPRTKSIDQLFEQTGEELGFNDMPIRFESDQYAPTEIIDQDTVVSYEPTEQIFRDGEESFDFGMFEQDSDLEDTVDLRTNIISGAANIEEESSDDLFEGIADEFKFTHDELGESQSEESFTEMFGLDPVSITSLPEDNPEQIEDDVFGGSREGFGVSLKSGAAPKMAPGFQG